MPRKEKMNISTNFSTVSSYSNLKLKNNVSQNPAINSVPSFKMANKIVKAGLVAAPLAAAYAGVEVMSKTEQNGEIVKVDENVKQSILFATSRISDFDGFDMAGFIDKNPKSVVELSEAKDNDGCYIFNAEDMAVILFNCKDIIEQNPNRVTEVLSDSENIKELSEAKNKFVRMWRMM